MNNEEVEKLIREKFAPYLTRIKIADGTLDEKLLLAYSYGFSDGLKYCNDFAEKRLIK